MDLVVLDAIYPVESPAAGSRKAIAPSSDWLANRSRARISPLANRSAIYDRRFSLGSIRGQHFDGEIGLVVASATR